MSSVEVDVQQTTSLPQARSTMRSPTSSPRDRPAAAGGSGAAGARVASGGASPDPDSALNATANAAMA